MGVPGNADLLLLRSAAAEGGYTISRSLRFNASDSAYLSRTPASAGNRKTWTWAGWVKRNRLGTQEAFFSAASDGSNRSAALFDSSDRLRFFNLSGGSVVADLVTTQVFRDPSAWYHIQIVLDTSQATSTNRYKLYVNNTQVTVFSTATYPAQDSTPFINSNVAHSIGRETGFAGEYASLMLADIHFIDGQALDPTSFGEFDDNGIWQPKAYSGGSYGTNGFKLNFSDNSTAAALGTDTSGNGNTWTVNNLNVLSSYTDTFLSRLPSGASWTNPTYAFDGTTANYADGTASNGTVSTIRFNKPLTGVTLLEYFYDGTSTYGYNSTDVGTGPNLTGGSWVTVYSGTAITVNNVRCTSQPGNGVVRLYAIRVNGTILNNWTEADPLGCDSLVDVPTNGSEVDTGSGGQVRGNYCTWNPLDNQGLTLANGNLDVSWSTNSWCSLKSTIGVGTGKWYYEYTVNSGSSNQIIGLFSTTTAFPAVGGSGYMTASASGWGYQLDGNKSNNNSFTSTGTTAAAGDVIMVAFDMDAAKVWFGKNGTWLNSGNPATGANAAFSNLSGILAPAVSLYGSQSGSLNAGSRSFAYTAPSGFKALCTANLPAPLVTKPSTAFDVKLYTGNGGTQTISGLGFSPDLVWAKSRSNALYGGLCDIVRGANKVIHSALTDAEYTYTDALTSFNSDGFSLGADASQAFNKSAATYAAWCWDAGNTTVTNTQGSISSQVRANASAGFSIVSWTGNATNGATVGHGLGVKPHLVIYKNRTDVEPWPVLSDVLLGPTGYLYLNSTAAKSDAAQVAAPTSTVLTLSSYNDANGNGDAMIAYCFAPVAGYSNGFSFTGNGSTDGRFVYLGFRPRLILLKCSSTTGNWTLLDTAREGYNVDNDPLYPNLSGAEGTADLLDITSNGFKLRTTDASVNSSGATYVGYAWAEAPFQYARAR